MTTITAQQLHTVLFSTEIGNDRSKLDTFSYAGNGTSSYSFGALQIDVGTDHGGVQQFLVHNGFTQRQIDQLSQQGGLGSKELGALNKQLQAIPQENMDAFVSVQLQSKLDRIDQLLTSLQGINPSAARAIANSPVLQLALADYDNQFTLSNIDKPGKPNTMKVFLEGQTVKLPGGELQAGDPMTRVDIQNFIHATKYGQENPRSVRSREQRLERALNDLNLVAQQGARGHDMAQAVAVSGIQDSPLFKDALTHLKAYNAAHGIPSDPRTEQAAAAIAVAAAGRGLSRIDLVEPNVDGSKLIAVQGKPGTVHSQVIGVPTLQALDTPIAASSQAFADAQQVHAAAAARTHREHTHQPAPHLAPVH